MHHRSKPWRTFILAALVALLALPAAAHARPLPSGSAIDEYSEGVPQASGQSPSTESGNGSLPPGTDAALQAKGKDGAAAAKTAKFTAPIPSGGGDSGSGSGGLGILLPLILGASLLTAVAIFVRRRQGATSG
jgi:hypothetical protein